MLITVLKIGDGWHTRDCELFATTPDVFSRIKKWVKHRIQSERNADLTYIQRAIHSATDPDTISMLKSRLIEKDKEYNAVIARLDSHTFADGSAHAFHHIHTYIVEQKTML